MKNLMVANIQPGGKFNMDKLEPMLKAQIDNALNLNWDLDDIILITNFDYEYRGVKGIQATLNNFCFTGSKMFAVQWAFENLLAPMQATVFSLLAFFVASASFRGFRARSISAAILLGTALLVLIGRTPLAENISSAIPDLTFWIKNYPSMAARRAILIGIGLGSMTTALRVILGIERTYLSGK